ncbi:uncharacterized protein [Littorina saxatilis]|uniref:Uncharacterized protein n=1 Tax=Littorina saxatilis TaxID=31220 RepID=A0AAN9BX29_9CAEN
MSLWRLPLCVAVVLVIWPPGCLAMRKGIQTLLTIVREIQQSLDRDIKATSKNAQTINTLLQKVRDVDEKLTSIQGVSRLIELGNGQYLAFRITPGVGSPAYDKYVAVKDSDDTEFLVFQNVPEGCKTTDGRLFCDRHYRSKLLDLWDKLPIGLVRVGLYTNNEEQRYFEFDGEGSNYLNWFSQDRLINSSYTDLSATMPLLKFFSIQGDPTFARTFFINQNFGDCSADAGWLVVTDSADPLCPWEKNRLTKPYPAIWFKNEDTVSSGWTNSETLGVADTLVISVKLKSTHL